MSNSLHFDDDVDIPIIERRNSIRVRRNSKVKQIYKFQYSMFYDVNDAVINTENNLLSITSDEANSINVCSEDVYATRISWDDNLEAERSDERFLMMKPWDDKSDLCSEDVYARISCDGNLEAEYFEINQSIKLLTDLDYFVPSFNPNLTPLYDYRDILTLNPLVTISSEIDANMYKYLRMKEESMHAGGVEINVTKKELLHMRLFKLNEFFWIVKCPEQYNNRKPFHFGDKIISVDGKEIPNFNRFKEILAATDMINVLKIRIQRLPHAKIFGVKVENYKSIFHLDEQSQIIVLNNLKDDDNNKWLITEIDGENIDYICNQVILEDFFDKQHDQYVTIVMHPINFLKINFQIILHKFMK